MTGPMPDEIRDMLKPKAIELRRRGQTYDEIAESLNISKSTCSLWLRDLPRPPRRPYTPERHAAMWEGHWIPYHERREKERLTVKLAACREVGEFDDRDILVAGALIYWCEGEKDKSYRRIEGWVYGAMLGGAAAEARLTSRSDAVLGQILGRRGGLGRPVPAREDPGRPSVSAD
ncbi:helix-turn-helix domain-containing protein [Actinomadura chokoriensis]|uniref:Homeodomain-like domain-containing protein n=1 Tax=Actinomadura chokoriensis TaxID=454156 RepID=A0ABV4QQB4_9ACTN